MCDWTLLSHCLFTTVENLYTIEFTLEIVGTSSYGEGCTSLQVHLHHMKECQIFHNTKSMTFPLYTFNTNLLLSSALSAYEIKM